MKKLKTWQKVLLIIFYPVGIVYFIIWLIYKDKSKPRASDYCEQPRYGIDTVFVNKGSKVYHADQMCADGRNCNSIEMHEKDAIKKGLRRCGRCYGNYNK